MGASGTSNASPLERTRLLIVGGPDGTNVGASLQRAAVRAGLKTAFVDARPAWAAPRIVRLVTWRLAGHRPPALRTLSRTVIETCRGFQPHYVLTTGLAPIDARSLMELGHMGVRRLNYLTDDPWNPTVRSAWFFAALHHYDQVFSVRRANLQDLVEHGCTSVGYVPFGYDADLFFRETPSISERAGFATDVVFVGGADVDRVPYIAGLIGAGFQVGLYGDYWRRYPQTRTHSRDHADPTIIRKATAAAKVALCLVRRANRDGQVMRSYEAAAMGACMLVEDTPEHRELFGPDGDAVVYFQTIDQMLLRLRRLLDAPGERRRLGAVVQQRIVAGQHTYDHRLQTMLHSAAQLSVASPTSRDEHISIAG